MAHYFGKRGGQQGADEPKNGSLEAELGIDAGTQIQKSLYPLDTKKLKKSDRRCRAMTEHDGIMSQQSLENQRIMNMPAGYMPDSINAYPSILDRSPVQRTDLLRKEVSRMSHPKLVDAYVDCMLEREIEQTKNVKLYNEAEQSRQRILDLERLLADQESVVREAQESAFALMASNISQAENDDKICSRLRMIRMQWKNFAKKWASKSMADIRKKEHILIRKMVNAWVAQDEDDSSDGIWAMENNAKAPPILLNTTLAHFIAENIILKPFTAAYNLKDSAARVSCDAFTIMNSLDELYAIKIKEDDRAAHQWRSQTVSLLELQQRHSALEFPASQQALEQRNEYYTELAYAFERLDARLLYRECDEEEETARLNHLVDLFCSAGDLFSRLWSQKVYIGTLDSPVLLRKPFDIGQDYYEAHATHKLEVSDKSKDGMPIQIVVEPGILAYGNELGESYEEFKMWGKAVVWLSSGGDGSKAPRHPNLSGATCH